MNEWFVGTASIQIADEKDEVINQKELISIIYLLTLSL